MRVYEFILGFLGRFLHEIGKLIRGEGFSALNGLKFGRDNWTCFAAFCWAEKFPIRLTTRTTGDDSSLAKFLDRHEWIFHVFNLLESLPSDALIRVEFLRCVSTVDGRLTRNGHFSMTWFITSATTWAWRALAQKIPGGRKRGWEITFVHCHLMVVAKKRKQFFTRLFTLFHSRNHNNADISSRLDV